MQLWLANHLQFIEFLIARLDHFLSLMFILPLKLNWIGLRVLGQRIDLWIAKHDTGTIFASSLSFSFVSISRIAPARTFQTCESRTTGCLWEGFCRCIRTLLHFWWKNSQLWFLVRYWSWIWERLDSSRSWGSSSFYACLSPLPFSSGVSQMLMNPCLFRLKSFKETAIFHFSFLVFTWP